MGCGLRSNSGPGGRDEGAATDFVCWAQSNHGPKWGKEKENEKGSFLFSEIIFVKGII
jgi:hypothetical protein